MADSESSFEHRLHLPAFASAAEAADRQLSRTTRRPSTVEPEFFVEVVKLARRYGFMVISDLAYVDVAFDGYQPPSFLAAPGAIDVGVEFTTMSKGYNMAGWRVASAPATPRWSAPWHDQELLRLRHVPGDPDRRHRGAAAYRRGGRGPGRRSISAAAMCCAKAWTHRLGYHAAQGDDVRVGQDPRAWQARWTRSTSP